MASPSLTQLIAAYRYHAYVALYFFIAADASSTIEGALRDITRRFPELKAAGAQFTANDGTDENLINITGTIRVTYQGAMYHIPLSIWLPRAYPSEAPIVYVVPAPGMRIAVSDAVDACGLVNIALCSWSSSPSASQYVLGDLLGRIQERFGRSTPLYSKPAAPSSTSSLKPNALNTSTAITNPSPPTVSPPPVRANLPQALPKHGAEPVQPRATYNEQEDVYETIRQITLGKLHTDIQEHELVASEELSLQASLEQKKAKLTAAVFELEEARTSVNRSLAILVEKNTEMVTAIDRLSGPTQISADDLVLCEFPIYTQHLALLAEDQAIDDALYGLSRLDCTTLPSHAEQRLRNCFRRRRCLWLIPCVMFAVCRDSSLWSDCSSRKCGKSRAMNKIASQMHYE